MSKISIKKDFVDGEKLFAQQLNNNFEVIEAGINANEENLQEVIDQAVEELDDELEAITADRGWDWNGGDRVTFFKGNTSQINSKAITNGQLLYNTETGETALDSSNTRIVTGSGSAVTVSNTAPTNLSTKEWIKPITMNGTDTAEEYFRDSNNEWKKILNQPSGDTVPVGTIENYSVNPQTYNPSNWMGCAGQALSRTEYSELFAAIGTTYGAGDGSTTFNLPDYNAVSPTGVEPYLNEYSMIKVKQSVGVVGNIQDYLSTDPIDPETGYYTSDPQDWVPNTNAIRDFIYRYIVNFDIGCINLGGGYQDSLGDSHYGGFCRIFTGRSTSTNLTANGEYEEEITFNTNLGDYAVILVTSNSLTSGVWCSGKKTANKKIKIKAKNTTSSAIVDFRMSYIVIV